MRDGVYEGPRVGESVGATEGAIDGWTVGCSQLCCAISIVDHNMQAYIFETTKLDGRMA